jgi:hypothetical protein
VGIYCRRHVLARELQQRDRPTTSFDRSTPFKCY